MARDYKIKYRCSFDVIILFIIQYFDDILLQVFQFPFDKQLCRGTISLPWKNNNTISLITSGEPINYGPQDLLTFRVVEVFANSTLTQDGSEFHFYVNLHRISTSFVITIFLQTFLLWFLVYLTLYIDINDFNNRFMGAITGFLVFASLLSSLMSSLPKSSGFKLADIWLLFFMFNIILVIIIHILIEWMVRRCSKIATGQRKFDVGNRKAEHISNTAAKVLLPMIISLFFIIYFFLTTA